LLIVPPALEYTAKTIVNADMIPSAAGTASQSNVLKGTADVLVIDELTDDTRWYLADVSKPMLPFIYQLRKEFVMIPKTSPNDDNVFFDRKLIYGTDGRCAVGYGPWWLCVTSKP
jgi:phage major head subunit gpT-like protein